MVTTDWAEAASALHRVTFYDDDSELAAELVAYLHAHLVDGGSAIVIATQAHRHDLAVALEGCGLSTRAMQREGRFVSLDAATALAGFADGGRLDPARFADTIGTAVERMLANGRPLLAFGEMVSLLWERGDVAAAIALEDLWNGIAARHSFGLLCAYRRACLDAPSLRAVNEMCAAHDEVTVPQFYRRHVLDEAGATQISPVFLPVTPAVAAARAFAQRAASDLGLGSMAGDIRIVVSELATNAVRHTASAFRVSLRLLEGVVRVEVHDAGSTYPQLGAARSDDTAGRGLSIIGRLARDWGFSPDREGKVTWAELLVH